MRRTRFTLVVLPAVAVAVSLATAAPGLEAQSPVRYRISFPNRVHHEAEIEVRFQDLDPGPLQVRMSRTSPGRYALHEFAKNVYGLRATDARGTPLPVHRPDPHQWNVTDHGGEVVVRYTLYADRADGTYSGVDESHGHLNVPATFVWARGLESRPVELMVHIPEGSGWRVATQMPAGSGDNVFTAPDLAYFLDSPVEVSDHDVREWTVEGQTIRIAMHHQGTDAELDRYAELARAIAREAVDVFGETPAFDFGSYTFLACYLPWVAGDGMEHRNSTVLTSTGSLEHNTVGLLGTVAHEFFHAWSIERMRPASLEPFDFESANMSMELWFGEGFTSYYDDLLMVRGDVIDVEPFARRVGGSVDFVVNAPGRNYFSPVEMSMQAPFVDAAVSVDPVNRANTFISYYTWGAAVGLGLDLTLRTRFPGLTLDHLMREMWRRHGSVERPYTVVDVETALAGVTGDADFAHDFFERFVRGREVPDYEGLFAAVGMRLGKARPGRAILARTRLAADDGTVRVVGGTLVGTPLYRAGVDRGDRILSVDGRTVDDPDQLTELMGERSPGDAVEIVYESRGRTRTRTVELMEDPSLRVSVDPDASGRAVELRRAWLERR